MKPGIFLARQLEQRLPQIYAKRYPDLWGINGEIIPSTGDLEEGTDTIIAEFIETIGEANLMSDVADDIPLVDVSIGEDKYPVVAPVTAFTYSIMQLNAAIKANRNLTSMKEMAAKRAIDEKGHKIAVFGSTKHKMPGLLNNSAVPLVDSTFNVAAANADELVDFVATQLNKVTTSSQQVEAIDTILVSDSMRKAMVTKRLAGTSDSVLTYLLANYGASTGGSLRRILAKNELAPSLLAEYGVRPDATKERMVFLPSNPDAVQRHFSLLTMMEPQVRGVNFLVPCYNYISPTIMHYPGSLLYVDLPAVV